MLGKHDSGTNCEKQLSLGTKLTIAIPWNISTQYCFCWTWSSCFGFGNPETEASTCWFADPNMQPQKLCLYCFASILHEKILSATYFMYRIETRTRFFKSSSICGILFNLILMDRGHIFRLIGAAVRHQAVELQSIHCTWNVNAIAYHNEIIGEICSNINN